ncbi:molybdenum cofactor guanylyltransferase [Marispirochaeta aestuarii]|uniref:molybdenum cofactor guanylyltransferase n=1 Tax=Marispirochaeta aestuarii TaxID=1963862 RepID=UPI0029C92078|nr:molybdenum cofactor guanylyltransferase [Marispirochaeta aestuarii]
MVYCSVPAISATAVVLAGGSSSRMGRNKARLRIGDKTLLEHITERMTGLFEEILVAAPAEGEHDIPGIRWVRDVYTAAGPLGGIHGGLTAAVTSRIFVSACDMPFFEAELAAFLLDGTDAYDAVVPCCQGFTEPLFAVYAKSALKKMEEYLRSGRRSVNRFLSRVNTLYVPEHEVRRRADPGRVFFNMNTPGDYLHLLSEIRQRDVQAAPLRSIPSSSPRSSAIPRKSPMAE